MFQHDSINILPDMDRYGEYFVTRREHTDKYRFAHAFHSYHDFFHNELQPSGRIHTCAIYLVGSQEMGIARSMGLKTRATVEEALSDAMSKYVGPHPNILALPRTLSQWSCICA